MGLFSTLSNTDNEVAAASVSSKSSLDLPTVVQLYGREPLLLEPQAASLPSYAMLSYSAVPLSNETIVQTPSNIKKKQAQQEPTPELGVWNVRIQPNHELNLLNDLPAASSGNTFALTVDLSAPEHVEPTMTLLQNALIRYLKERGADNGNAAMTDPSETATTSLYDLQTAHFGLAPEDTLATSIEPDPKDRQCKFCLILVAKVATLAESSEDLQYRDRQVQALLKYHLYKFASQLQCYLFFVGDKVDDDEKESSSASMTPIHTPPEVAALFKDLAQGTPPVKPLTIEPQASEDEAESTVMEQELSIFAPDNAEFVDTILLRNANFPGQWEAATTSVWKILAPPAPSASASTSSKVGTTSGDQGWLKELRDSVAVPTTADKTPVKTTKKEVEPNKTPGDDKNVSSYFESLLGM